MINCNYYLIAVFLCENNRYGHHKACVLDTLKNNKLKIETCSQ